MSDWWIPKDDKFAGMYKYHKQNIILWRITWIDSDIHFLFFISPFGILNLRGTPSEGSGRDIVLCHHSSIDFNKSIYNIWQLKDWITKFKKALILGVFLPGLVKVIVSSPNVGNLVDKCPFKWIPNLIKCIYLKHTFSLSANNDALYYIPDPVAGT